MKPFPHTYSTRLAGGPEGYGALAADGVPPLSTAAPAEFDGPGDAWSPEGLFLASISSCFLMTLRAVARASKVPFVDAAVAAEGVVDRPTGTTRFTEIVLRVTLTVPPGIDHARATAVIEKAERACLVSASVSTPIRLESAVVDAGAVAA